jgi:hypothetical protein
MPLGSLTLFDFIPIFLLTGLALKVAPPGTVFQHGDQNYIQEIGSINIIRAGLTINSKAPDTDDYLGVEAPGAASAPR